MGAKLSIEDIHATLRELNLIADGERLLIVGTCDGESDLASSHDVVRLGRVRGPNDICDTTRADISVVIDQLEHMSKDDGTHLLSRLRDLISHRVLLLLRGDAWTPDELLAIGYQEVNHTSDNGRYYLFDPDLYYQPRAWNNASGWANPDNFGKYRW